MGIATSLECRLLCASACAYGISVDGAFTPTQPYYDAVGFQKTPMPIAAGCDNINACLVGTSGDGVLVAFRGTLALRPEICDLPSLLDWMQDFDAAPRVVEDIQGRVHDGFWRGLDTLWEKVLAVVKPLVSRDGRSAPLYLTGHSKGGAFAHLAAMRFCTAGITAPEVYTYAAPRVGDKEFANAYNQAIQAFRYEYMDDIVPHLPPKPLLVDTMAQLPTVGRHFKGLPKWDYADVGTLRFIDWNGKIVGDSESLEEERTVHLALLIVRRQFPQIVADHNYECGGGYLSQLCPGVCPNS